METFAMWLKKACVKIQKSTPLAHKATLPAQPLCTYRLENRVKLLVALIQFFFILVILNCVIMQ